MGLSRETKAEGLLTVLKQRLVVCKFSFKTASLPTTTDILHGEFQKEKFMVKTLTFLIRGDSCDLANTDAWRETDF